ncbi:cell envelope integrity protein TolA [Ichthyobacterium seriolicida]|uniref:Lipoprotein n=1 Tax=Ichthyobacterium seriolicida TaxID=242600 RepID=A0A1J1ECY2_9FLAO|nr:cell envelope integrity protein TolA [Ichthyobacterium seriolicida]BAV95376.1 hypothetical protein JBKA6_1363 [Ichthyobacterium seriolicida]
MKIFNLKKILVFTSVFFIALSCKKAEVVAEGEIPKSKILKEIISFKLEAFKNEGKIGEKDIEAKSLDFKGQKIYFLILPNGVGPNYKKFIPTITISDNTTVEPKSDIPTSLGNISITEETIDLLKSGVEYTVTSDKDNSVSKYRVIAIRTPQGIESIDFKGEDDIKPHVGKVIDNLNEEISLISSVSSFSAYEDNAILSISDMEIKLNSLENDIPSFISFEGEKRSIDTSVSVKTETSFTKKNRENTDIYEAEIPVLIKIGDLEFIRNYAVVINPKTTELPAANVLAPEVKPRTQATGQDDQQGTEIKILPSSAKSTGTSSIPTKPTVISAPTSFQSEEQKEAKEEATRKAKEEATRKAKEEATRKAKEEATRKAKEFAAKAEELAVKAEELATKAEAEVNKAKDARRAQDTARDTTTRDRAQRNARRAKDAAANHADSAATTASEAVRAAFDSDKEAKKAQNTESEEYAKLAQAAAARANVAAEIAKKAKRDTNLAYMAPSKKD